MFDRLFQQSVDEKTLIENAKKSQRSFGDLFDRYADCVYRFVRRRVASNEDAEDIVSEVFMTVAAKIGDYDTTRDQKFTTWLLGIAHYKLLAHLRSQYSDSMDTLYEEHESMADYDLVSYLTNKQLYESVIEYVKTMSDRQSSIFFLKYIEGYGNQEIAHIFDIHEKTVSSTINAVLTKIHTRFGTSSALQSGMQ